MKQSVRKSSYKSSTIKSYCSDSKNKKEDSESECEEISRGNLNNRQNGVSSNSKNIGKYKLEELSQKINTQIKKANEANMGKGSIEGKSTKSELLDSDCKKKKKESLGKISHAESETLNEKIQGKKVEHSEANKYDKFLNIDVLGRFMQLGKKYEKMEADGVPKAEFMNAINRTYDSICGALESLS